MPTAPARSGDSLDARFQRAERPAEASASKAKPTAAQSTWMMNRQVRGLNIPFLTQSDKIHTRP
jgi:hypothetical protein